MCPDNQKLQYYRGNYSECVSGCVWTGLVIIPSVTCPLDDFKKMYMQKFKEMEKAYTKQVKAIKVMKSQGKSRANAVSDQYISFISTYIMWALWWALFRKLLLRTPKPR